MKAVRQGKCLAICLAIASLSMIGLLYIFYVSDRHNSPSSFVKLQILAKEIEAELTSIIPNSLPGFCVLCQKDAKYQAGKMAHCEIIEQGSRAGDSKLSQSWQLISHWLKPWHEQKKDFHTAWFTDADGQRHFVRYLQNHRLKGDLATFTDYWRTNVDQPIFESIKNFEKPVTLDHLEDAWLREGERDRFVDHSPWYRYDFAKFMKEYPEGGIYTMAAGSWRNLVAETVNGTQTLAAKKIDIQYSYIFDLSAKPLRPLFAKYGKFFKGKRGVVIGSQFPWLEYEALRFGAAEITTVDYFNLSSVIPPWHRYMKFMHVNELGEKLSTGEMVGHFDFALSYSSIEHSGLGRYTDPLNPDGDIMELAKISCMIKPGGILLLGIPVSGDCVSYNMHRYYGPIRYQLLAECWKFVDHAANETEQLFHSDKRCGPDSNVQPWLAFQNLQGCAL